MKTFRIMVRMELETKEQEDAFKTVLRMSAKHMLATSMLLCNGQSPEVAIDSEDFFEGREQIELADDIE